jgi:hypothetical protein
MKRLFDPRVVSSLINFSKDFPQFLHQKAIWQGEKGKSETSKGYVVENIELLKNSKRVKLLFLNFLEKSGDCNL